jgi:hypothetical protein
MAEKKEPPKKKPEPDPGWDHPAESKLMYKGADLPGRKKNKL